MVPGQGTWSINSTTGAITFTPLANYDGVVTDITYRVRDDDGTLSNTVPVSVTINPVNDVPVAVFDGDTVLEDLDLRGAWIRADGCEFLGNALAQVCDG